MAEQVLEVTQWWGEEVLDSSTFGAERPRVSIGWRSGTRWQFLGVDMGYVPTLLSPVLAAVAPGWSELRRERRADFAVPEPADDDDWELVIARDDRRVVRVPPGWTADLAGALGDDGVLEIELGQEPLTVERAPFRFELRLAPRATRVDSRMLVDTGFLGAAASVLFLLAIVGLGTALAPTARAVSAPMDTERMLAVVLDAPPPPVKAAKGGKSGEKEKKAEGARPKTKETKSDGRKSDREVAERSGVLGDVDAILGGAELSDALRAGVGGLIGFQGGIGGNGLGNRGPGIGGGGVAEGIGGLGPRGRGPGGPGLYDGGPGKQPGELALPETGVVLVGQLDRAQIDEVIKRHLSQVRYCYQRQLQRNPGLGGKVTVKFTISGDGTVSAARAGGSLGDDLVRSCITTRFMTMQFPAPRGGGLVVVSYPFLFSPG